MHFIIMFGSFYLITNFCVSRDERYTIEMYDCYSGNCMYYCNGSHSIDLV